MHICKIQRMNVRSVPSDDSGTTVDPSECVQTFQKHVFRAPQPKHSTVSSDAVRVELSLISSFNQIHFRNDID